MIVCRLINIDRWVNFCGLLCGDDLDKNVVKAASDALALPTSCCKQQDLAQDVEICWRGYVLGQNMVARSINTAEKVLQEL